ncbi:MAG: hypothetical protein JWO19_5117 [Bryobacterales bacterium]|nr:hypothetical protein [Bryobacterales bacterium]
MSTGVLSPSFAAQAPGGFSGTRWIISRQDDLVWFVGTALVGYLALALMVAGVPLALITVVWLLGVDGPHVTGTVTRTYFDKQERRRLGWLLWALVPLLFIGPLAVYLGQSALFYLFAVCWQHYHITKQHVGFVMLWKAKNKERDATEMRLDRWFLLASGVIPLALFVVKTRIEPGTFVNAITAGGIAVFAVLTAIFVVYQIRKWRAGKPMNLPKLLLLAGLVPLQWLAFGYAARFGPDGIVRAGIALGLFHSLQYHRLMWFHNKNRYQTPDARAKHGFAAVLAQGFGYYFAAAVGLYFIADVLPQALFPVQWLPAALWGIAFMHYLLDSKIWRVRGDKELAAALQM